MLKQNSCPIEASNIANLGSELEKKIKAAAAECEHAWDGVGKQAMLRIWRIEKFKVVAWPEEELGRFYDGDSYIVLHSYHKTPSTPALSHDVHFWLGDNTSQDEAGTAAYKTVELDDRLGGAPVQHREVQGHESELFLSYFTERTIEVMKGGIESGFNHVEEEKYKTRLLQVKGTKKHVRVTEVEKDRSSLNSGDVFILDKGMTLIQWNGKATSLYEKMKAGQLARAIRDERKGKPEAYIYDEGDDGDEHLNDFWAEVGGNGPVKSAAEGGADDDAAKAAAADVKLFRLTDSDGDIKFKLEATGALSKNSLDTSDVFILDSGSEVFVWIGRKSSKVERRNGMGYAQQYLTDNALPAYRPISRVLEGGENEVFNSIFETSRGFDMFDESANALPACCPHKPKNTAKWDFLKEQPNTSVGKQWRDRGEPTNDATKELAGQVFGFFSNKAKSKGWF